MVKAKKYILKSHFNGFPKATDLELVEEELPELKDGGKYGSCRELNFVSKFVVEFLAEAVVLSVDPYMRSFEKNLDIGTTFIGSQVAK